MEKAQPNSSAHVCTPKTPAAYIANLPAWDKVHRLDFWLPHVLDETPATAGMHRMEYLSLVGRYWLLGMVRRVMEPGCKFDYCPVLEGLGGLRKSTLAAVLAGREFFSDTPAPNDRDSALEAIQSIWLYEVVELSALNATEKASLKAYLSQCIDVRRTPFTTEFKYTPRHFAVVATTNENGYRRKGVDRRFWPVPVRNAINISWVETHRDQLFAEAKVRLKDALRMVDLAKHPGKPGVNGRGAAA